MAGNPSELPTGYWHESRRPLVCLAFVAPMLAVYELGVLTLGAQATRNGIDVYLRNSLELIGFGQYFLLPALTAFALLAWHHMCRHPWRLKIPNLLGMLFESILLAMALLVLARLQSSLMPTAIGCSTGESSEALGTASRLVGYLGAGIYEELFFRLILLLPLAGLIGYFGVSRQACLWSAVAITSLLFSAAHYEVFTFNTGAEPFAWFSFLFRLSAGGFFATLFLYRGFGIAAGTHALYDILVETL